MSTVGDPAAVPGLPECLLSDAERGSLPATSPPAPWSCRVQAVLWWQYARPPRFPFARRPLPVATVAFVSYLDTPVGPYREILAGVVLAAGPFPPVQVPFIAVDSLASVHGGRVNWALPKGIATFDGAVGSGTAQAVGVDWSARVEVGRAGPALPVRARLTSVGPLGRSRTVLRGRSRAVTVRTSVQGATIGPWLRSGRHLGLSFDGTVTVGAPQPRPGGVGAPR